jgi:hypothetical protein
MSKRTQAPRRKKTDSKAVLQVTADPEISEQRRLANVSIDPAANAMASIRLFNTGSFGEQHTTELYDALSERAKAAKEGDLSRYRAMLASQAEVLNSIFTEMSRRAALNMGEYLTATQLYMRLGLKAQAQCRATIEALEGLTSGRVQTVKHVHVNQGGQAVVADHFHQHTGGKENGQSSEQPHATGTAGQSAALPSPDPLGPAVPIASGEGKEAVPYARRQRQRRAGGQP